MTSYREYEVLNKIGIEVMENNKKVKVIAIRDYRNNSFYEKISEIKDNELKKEIKNYLNDIKEYVTDNNELPLW